MAWDLSKAASLAARLPPKSVIDMPLNPYKPAINPRSKCLFLSVSYG